MDGQFKMLDDKAGLHSAEATVEAIRQLTFDYLPHRTNNPDRAASDYHMSRL